MAREAPISGPPFQAANVGLKRSSVAASAATRAGNGNLSGQWRVRTETLRTRNLRQGDSFNGLFLLDSGERGIREPAMFGVSTTTDPRLNVVFF
jgi:hypothetical protein